MLLPQTAFIVHLTLSRLYSDVHFLALRVCIKIAQPGGRIPATSKSFGIFLLHLVKAQKHRAYDFAQHEDGVVGSELGEAARDGEGAANGRHLLPAQHVRH